MLQITIIVCNVYNHTNVRELKKLVFFHFRVHILLTAGIYCEYLYLLQTKHQNLGDHITKQFLQVPFPHYSHHYFPTVLEPTMLIDLPCCLIT